MEPVTCQALLDNPAPPEKDPGLASQPPECASRTLRGAVQGKVSSLYMRLLSLRLGLVGWYFCLKKIQWDVVRWIHISLELAVDVFFGWVQNALLAFMMLLLLAWKVQSGARQHGWKTLLWSLTAEVQHAWGRSLLRGRCCSLKNSVVQAAWAPAYWFAWSICHLVGALEAVFTQAAMMAGEDQEEEVEEGEETLPELVSALALQCEERDPSGSQ